MKCVLQFTCTNLDGSQKEGRGGGNFLNLLQKEEGTQKGGGGGGPTLEETMSMHLKARSSGYRNILVKIEG